jgi:hypothetical protein
VTLTLTSNATNGISSSEIVVYTADVSATCTYSDGSTAACPVPSGVVSYEIDGADAPVGNYTYLSSDATPCDQAVGSSLTGVGCQITWYTYGDQWITATYLSSGAPSVAQTVEVDIQAPVDLAVGRSYSNYQNAGPGEIGDCTMASVADWIETSLNTTPSESDTVAAYWAAENEYNGGADVGLTDGQLFSYWQNTGIDGTSLTSSQYVTTEAAAETALSSGTVLINSEILPTDSLLNGGSESVGHMWIMVGYSSYGPMIVTWGEEVQIPWADFNAWTQYVYAVMVSS